MLDRQHGASLRKLMTDVSFEYINFRSKGCQRSFAAQGRGALFVVCSSVHRTYITYSLRYKVVKCFTTVAAAY